MDNEECNMIQANILTYVSVQPSVSSDKFYVVVWSEEKKRYVCTDGKGNMGCDHERKRSEQTKLLEPCRHVLKHRNDMFRQRVTYLENRQDWKDCEAFENFEQVIERLRHSKNYEISYICNIALCLAYTAKDGRVKSDHVYVVVDGHFESKGVMGMAFRIMKDRGLLKFLYYEASETPSNHGAVIGWYEITPEGRAAVEGGGTEA